MNNKLTKVTYLHLCLLLFVIILSFILYLNYGFNYFGSLKILFIGIIALVLLFIPEIIRKRNDLFEPINFVILSVTMGVVFRTMFILFGDIPYIEKTFFIQGDIEFLLKGATLILLGVISLVLGYLINIKISNLSNLSILRKEKWDIKRLYFTYATFIVISFLAVYDYIKRAGIDITSLTGLSQKREILINSSSVAYSSLGYHILGTTFISIVLLLYFSQTLTKNKKIFSIKTVVLFLLFALSSFFPFITSNRWQLLFPILALMTLYHYLKKEIKIKHLIIIGAIALLLILIFAIIRPPQDINRELIPNTPNEIINNVIKSSIGTTNFLDIAKISHIIKGLGKTIQQKYGETLIRWIYAPIPKQIWPEKPDVGLGNEIEESIFKFGGGTPPSIIGELYWNFKTSGVVLGMFILGIFLNSIYLGFRKNITRNSTLFYIPILFGFTITLFSSSASMTMINTITYLIPILIAIKIVSKK